MKKNIYSPGYLIKIFIVAFFILTCRIGFAQIAPIYPPDGGFHVDGNLRANTPTADIGDWLMGPGGPGGFLMSDAGVVIDTARTFHFVDAWNGGDDIFTGGRRNDNPNTQWTWGTGSSNNKTDFNNVLIHVGADTVVGCHTCFMFAADRLSNSGTSYVDFEFLQNTLTKNVGGTFTSAASNSTGGRTVNDLLFAVEYTGGGGSASIYFYSWQFTAGVYQYVAFTPPAGKAFGFTSAGGEPVPFGAFGSFTYQSNQFVEGAVDLDAIVQAYLTFPNIVFKTLFVKTKPSVTDVQLVDFITPKQLNNLTLNCPVGIEENELQNAIRIYPNPANSAFTIAFNNQSSFINSQLKIYDVTGRVVHEQKNQSQISTVNCQLTAGIYFVELREIPQGGVSEGKKVFTQKLVIE